MQRADRHDREQFITALCAAVPTATRAHALRLLRWGRTYGRLAEAQCNGDWPADNGTVPHWECGDCGRVWRTQPPAGGYDLAVCPSCRAERIIRETCDAFGPHDLQPPHVPAAEGSIWRCPWVRADFQGDPRGYTVRLQVAGAPLDAYERPALAVPTS